MNKLFKGQFDAVLFDAGGVLLLPDPSVLGPLLAPLGGSLDHEVHRRAHYASMANKSRQRASETDWHPYNDVYVDVVGVDIAERAHAAEVLERTRNAHLWRWPITDTVEALGRLAAAGVPMGVVSNASGQIEDVLLRTNVCQAGEGPGTPMRVVIDSEVVGVAKPDPRIFDFALPHFEEFDSGRILYVGDSVMMDVEGSTLAGLHPVLVDPFDDHPDADFDRIERVSELVEIF